MGVPGEFYLYAATYRLALLAVGALAILLGYRLFLRGVGTGSGTRDGSGTDAAAEAGGFKFSLGNAAPGTCFALFGAMLIVAMAVDGNPEYLRQRGGPAADRTNGPQQAGLRGAAYEEIRVKGRDDTGPIAMAAAGGGQTAAPAFAGRDLDAYRRSLAKPDASAGEIADAVAGVAHRYLAEARAAEALTLARLAVDIDAADPEKLDLLAAAARANALAGEAAAAQAQAAQLRHVTR